MRIHPDLCRRFTALHVSSSLLSRNNSKADVDEVAGHVYLYLKEQLELATPPLSYGLLHGTIIGESLLLRNSCRIRIVAVMFVHSRLYNVFVDSC